MTRQREAVCFCLMGIAGACVLACQWLPLWLCAPAGILALLLIHPYRRWQRRRVSRSEWREMEGDDPAEVVAQVPH